MTDRLFRSPTDRVIGGVAGGMAVWLDVDAALIRLGWVLLAIFSGGIFVLVYIVLMIVLPLPPPGVVLRPRGAGGWQPGGPGAVPGTGAVPGWQPGGDPPPAPGQPTGQPPGQAPGWSAPQPPWTPGPRSGQNAGVVVGAILVALGIWFLVAPYVHLDWRVVWPVVVIVIGGALIARAMRRTPRG